MSHVCQCSHIRATRDMHCCARRNGLGSCQYLTGALCVIECINCRYGVILCSESAHNGEVVSAHLFHWRNCPVAAAAFLLYWFPEFRGALVGWSSSLTFRPLKISPLGCSDMSATDYPPPRCFSRKNRSAKTRILYGSGKILYIVFRSPTFR